MADNKTEEGSNNRRNFLRLGLMSSAGVVAAASLISNLASDDVDGVLKVINQVILIYYYLNNISNFPFIALLSNMLTINILLISFVPS